MKFHRARVALRVFLYAGMAIATCWYAHAVQPSSPRISSLDAVAQAKISAALGRDMSLYHATVSGGEIRASNPAQKLTLHFGSDKVRIQDGDAKWSMAFVGSGRGKRISYIAAVPRAKLNRVEYDRGNLTEWYVNGPAGLEQGFMIREVPSRSNEPLTIALRVGGMARRGPDDSVTITGVAGKAQLRYSGIAAFDANGKRLKSWTRAWKDELLLEVDDHNARYPVTVDPLIQLAELTPTDRFTNDWFGICSAVSGNTVVVGAFDSNIEQTGAAYVFVRPSTGWSNMTQTAKLTASDQGSGFGNAVAIQGNTIVVGAAIASNFKDQAQGPGAAYVFVKPSTGWVDMTETAKLTASDGQSGDAFGNTVSVSGNTVAVGAMFAHGGAGAAYVFVKPSTGWIDATENAQLTASDGTSFDNMGVAAISGNTVVTGALGHNNFQGSAYVFVRPTAGWKSMTQTAELSASDGKPSADFGFSAAISADAGTIIVGAPGAGNFRGAAYIFVKQTNWKNSTQTAELGQPNGAQFNSFGQTVGISGSLAIVGAPGTTVGANQGEGVVDVYLKSKAGWKSTSRAFAELSPSDGTAFDGFGVSASVSGSTIVAGATGSNTVGTAYVFGP